MILPNIILSLLGKGQWGYQGAVIEGRDVSLSLLALYFPAITKSQGWDLFSGMLYSVVKVEKKQHWQCQDLKKKGNVHSSVLPWRKQCRRLKREHSRDRQCKSKLGQDKRRTARWAIWRTLEISQQYQCQITSATSYSTLLLRDAAIVRHSCNGYKLACLLRAVIVRFCLYDSVTTVKGCYVIQFFVQTVG